MKKNTKRSILADRHTFIEKGAYQLVLTILFLTFCTSIFAQTKTEEKANLAYQYKQYSQAASLYEEAILEKSQKNSSSKSLLNLKTKLAFCYRMNNKLDKAEELYAEIVHDDRAKSETYFFYGETLMSNGKYEEAKLWFKDYQILEPEDDRGALMAANCDKVKLIKPFFPNAIVTAFPYNSDADDNAPVFWQNGIVFSSDRKQGLKLMKEKSGWTGRDYLDLYFSEIQEDSTFGEPHQFSTKLSEINKNTGNASFSTDGAEVYFTRNDNVLNKRESYNLQLYRSLNNGGDRWKKAEKLTFCSPNYNYMHPAISPDGQSLFFASNMKGEGGTDLWVSIRRGKDWGIPENLGNIINTPANEGFPFMDENGRLYFCSKGHPGFGGFDVFFTERNNDGSWATPQNLGKPINSPLDDISIYISSAQNNGLFTSSRDGGDDDIYLFEVIEEASHSNEKVQVFVNEKPDSALKKLAPTKQETIYEIEEEPINEKEQEEVAFLKSEEISEPKTIEKQQIYSPAENPSSIFFDVREQNEPDSGLSKTSASSTSHLLLFSDFIENANGMKIRSGEVYRIDGAVFDPNIWQLTPRISKKLDELVAVMRRFPSMRIELSAHTATPGLESQNLELSKNRVQMAMEYLKKEGIAAERIMGVGYGESLPLNHCLDGITCTQEEHLFNQRFEVKVIIGNEN